MPPTPAQIEAFLDKLNNDTSFRELLVSDPETALGQYDIEWDYPNYDPNNASLPDVGEVNNNRSAYKDILFDDADFLRNGIDFSLPDP